MRANQADFPVRTMCRLLKVSASGFYAWQQRVPSKRAINDAVLTERIRLIHAASDGNYGSPNIHAELREDGTRVGRKRVARLMRNACIRGVSRRRAFVVTTKRDPERRPAPDLVNRQFVADAPNKLWVAAGIVAYRLLRYEGVTVGSFCPPRTSVGTFSVERFCDGEKGASAMPALSEGRCSVA